MKVTFYTNGCPRCNILKQKLNEKEINFIECDDINLLMDKGFMTVPMLEVGNSIMDFGAALNWLKDVQ